MKNKAAAAVAVLMGAFGAAWAAPAKPPGPKPPPAVPAGRLTQAQAVAEARAFCRAIGAPVSGPAAVAPSDAEDSPYLPPTYWQPCRRIRFGGVEVVVADSGVVCRYFKSSEAGREPAGAAISRRAALAKAAAVLAAAHVTEPLAAPEAQVDNVTSPPQREGHEWFVIRRRQAQGVTFQYQQATVILQAETGAVIGLGVTFPTPPPAPAKPVLTQAQAIAAAQAALASRPHSMAGMRPVGSVRLIWVTPQTESVTPGVNGVVNSPPLPSRAKALPPRLAWMCSFGNARGDGAFLPVDVVTGKILPSGVGYAYGPLRFPPAPRTPTPPAPGTPAPPAPEPPPPPAVVDHPIAASTLPGATVASPPPNVRRYRLSLTDIYAPLAVLTALGFHTNELQLGGNEETDRQIAEKLEQAARDGKLILQPGPSAVVPEGGVWALARTRETLCKDPIYWQPRPAPVEIGMTFSVTPQKQGSQIMYRFQTGAKALNIGQPWSGSGRSDEQTSGNSWGDVGATTFLSGQEEERYSWQTGTPGRILSDGILHILLVRGVPLP